MGFSHGETVYRDRRPLVTDTVNPQRQVPGAWVDAATIAIEGAYIGPASSRDASTATRDQTVTALSLFVTDTSVDVKKGDRIRVDGTEEDPDSGTAYMVIARPITDKNPFTGWSPVKEIPLELVEG